MMTHKLPGVLLKTDLSFLKCPIRCKGQGPNHWAVLRRTKFPKDHAMEHFDDFYANVYGARKWKSMRLALLCPKKYCAVVNNYSDADKIMNKLENKGAVNVRRMFELRAEKLAEEPSNYLEPLKKDEVYKLDLDAKMNTLRISSLEKEAQKKIPNVPLDKTLTYMQSADVEVESPAAEKPAALMNTEDDEEPPSPIDDGGNLEPTEEEIKSRLVRSADALYDFVPATKLQGLEDYVPESKHYGYYETESEFPIYITEDAPIVFPSNLNIYTYETGNIEDFSSPKRGSTDLFDYFLLDGASLFPILALNLQPNDRILDLCAAPGGKSLIMLQTLFPRFLTCNDFSETRLKRLRYILKDYFTDIDDKVSVTNINGSQYQEETNFYNKILVDVPCTTDRLSVNDNDDNIFAPNRIQERLQLPEAQAALLVNALKLVTVGGTVVYSTCTLSPIQNDGVVHMALKKIWEETELQFVIKDMSKVLEVARPLFPLETKLDLKYGHLVCPYLPANFGPMYFCKLVRVK
ncbi:unnamed protein product [Bemisia tabaci]|uniref:NOL1/NOP2/Sun domain family member 4 n=1 Tax=Bemisia tabaci TaxID=7038 RepID=A0A9P0AET6_BEMTA|nr:PREDICTED: 5-methylcytosine rRNA methyltransferase NSUN4 [Bemisia tabaci]XP_018910071.1 PREDICTED: 5-methylcytosine rRNA methyltransferase NSUN4 [Bemisia tabaci]XP_018910072.1 PREDICTED: 5-methylcytosine rRNA methyltransferase NSUN4 [Bemisia tabaci]XP_018910073.1 PREDICTED: 5-methylcytosine rRNA methyltransferase NSUN4 [Bemisia tabaci]XP_018910074.1 PREDICTED: 5-methylcytosine rRNA methyltransferase NSUN4 [Bemisia tabaci]CAH0391632.1 unnamed protein product [Bemisia tabaci]